MNPRNLINPVESLFHFKRNPSAKKRKLLPLLEVIEIAQIGNNK